MTHVLPYLLLGLVAGIFSGLVGIGGGMIIVPVLVFLFHISQHEAQRTTLTMLVPPIGLPAALLYYRLGYVDLKVAALIGGGFFVGCLLGAKLATGMSDPLLEKVFGIAMLLIALKMIVAQ